MLFHVAPRILKWNEHFSDCIHPTNGILAGAKRPNSLSRIFLYPIIHKLHANIPPHIIHDIGVFVDDLAQTVFVGEKSSDNALGEQMIIVARRLATMVQNAKLRISSKTTEVTSKDMQQTTCRDKKHSMLMSRNT